VGTANKKVYVPAGSYSLTSSIISVAEGVTLYGDGASSAGTVFNFVASSGFNRLRIYNVSNVALESFRFTGQGRIEFYANTGSSYGGFTVSDVVAYHTTSDAFVTWTANKSEFSGVTFRHCQAIGPMGCGFWIGGDYSNQDNDLTRANAGWTRNVRFEDCLSQQSGTYAGRTTDYICGFDLSEGCNVSGMSLVRCTSAQSYVDGFHFEWAPSTECVFTDCVANTNGVAKGSGYGVLFREEDGHHNEFNNFTGTGNQGGLAKSNTTGTVYANGTTLNGVL